MYEYFWELEGTERVSNLCGDISFFLIPSPLLNIGAGAQFQNGTYNDEDSLAAVSTNFCLVDLNNRCSFCHTEQ